MRKRHCLSYGIALSIPFIILTALKTSPAATNANVLLELEITDGVITRVEELMPEEATQELIDNLAVAVDMQADAWSAYERDEQFLALTLTRQAREIALRIERTILRMTITPDDGSLDGILRTLGQNAEIMEDIAPAVEEFGDEILRIELSAIAEVQEQAWQLFEDEEYAVSGKLARSVRDRLVKIRGAIFDTKDRYNSETAALEMERTREILAFAQSKVFPEAIEAIELLGMAEEILAEAEIFFANTRLREAMKLADEATILARRAIEISRKGGIVLDRIEEEFQRTEQAIYNVKESFDENTPPEVREIADKASRLLEDARSAFMNGQAESSEKLLIESRRTTELARRSAQDTGDINRWNVERAISNTDRIIEHTTKLVDGSGSSEAANLLEQANDLQSKAREHFDGDKYREALTSTRAAADAASQASRRAGEK